jgi:hypothetical protein
MTEERLNDIRSEIQVRMTSNSEKERFSEQHVLCGRKKTEYGGDAGMAKEVKLTLFHPRIGFTAHRNEFNKIE